MKKFILALIMTCLITSSATVAVAASPPLKIQLNGTEMNFPNKPILVDGTTMVPFRNLLESLGVKVDFDASTNTITTTGNNTTVKLIVGEKVAVKNGQLIQLTQAPYVKNSVTYVPLRFLSQSFGYEVDFKNNTVYIKASSSAKGNKPILSIEQVGKLANRVAYIEVFDSKGKLYSTGSGVAVGSEGEILTNYHVIEGATKVKVYIDNNEYETKTILKQDIDRDLALIKIKASSLPIVELGSSSTLALGEAVVAIGSPLGFSNTLSSGNISNVTRELDGVKFVQTTAPIDHGSSGGALFNMKGELIGITTALIYSSANLNFAIPSDDVSPFLMKPNKATEMVGKTSTGKDLPEIYSNINYLQGTLNEEITSFYNEELNFEFYLDWYVMYEEEEDTYIVSIMLNEYSEYLDFVKHVSQVQGETGILSAYIFDEIEYISGLTNVALAYVINDEIDFAPDYSVIPPSEVTEVDGKYEIIYFYSYALRSGNEIEYINHELFDDIERMINLNDALNM